MFFSTKKGSPKTPKEFLLDLALGCLEADASATVTSAPQEGRAAGTDLNWCLGLASKRRGSFGSEEKDGEVVVSDIFYFHPYLGKIPILTNIFQMG